MSLQKENVKYATMARKGDVQYNTRGTSKKVEYRANRKSILTNPHFARQISSILRLFSGES